MAAIPIHSMRVMRSPNTAIDDRIAMTGTANRLSDAVPAGSQRRISIYTRKPPAVEMAPTKNIRPA